MKLRKIKDEEELRSLELPIKVNYYSSGKDISIVAIGDEEVCIKADGIFLIKSIDEALAHMKIKAPEPKRVRLYEYIGIDTGAVYILTEDYKRPRLDTKDFIAMSELPKIKNGRQFDLIQHDDKAWELEAVSGGSDE